MSTNTADVTSSGKAYDVRPDNASTFAVSDAKAAFAAEECEIDLDAEGKGMARWISFL